MLLASHHVSGACMGGRQGVIRWWLLWLGVSSQALMLQLMPSANHRAPQRQPSHRMFGGRHCSGARMGRWGGSESHPSAVLPCLHAPTWTLMLSASHAVIYLHNQTHHSRPGMRLFREHAVTRHHRARTRLPVRRPVKYMQFHCADAQVEEGCM